MFFFLTVLQETTATAAAQMWRVAAATLVALAALSRWKTWTSQERRTNWRWSRRSSGSQCPCWSPTMSTSSCWLSGYSTGWVWVHIRPIWVCFSRLSWLNKIFTNKAMQQVKYRCASDHEYELCWMSGCSTGWVWVHVRLLWVCFSRLSDCSTRWVPTGCMTRFLTEWVWVHVRLLYMCFKWGVKLLNKMSNSKENMSTSSCWLSGCPTRWGEYEYMSDHDEYCFSWLSDYSATWELVNRIWAWVLVGCQAAQQDECEYMSDYYE